MHIPPNWPTFFALIVSFLVFWFIFSRLFFRPFLNLLAQREKRFRELGERSEQLIRQARAADQECETRLGSIRKEALSRRETQRREAEAAAARLMARAKDQAHSTLERARATIEDELRSAERQIEEMGRRLADDLAERVLGRDLDGRGAPRSDG